MLQAQKNTFKVGFTIAIDYQKNFDYLLMFCCLVVLFST